MTGKGESGPGHLPVSLSSGQGADKDSYMLELPEILSSEMLALPDLLRRDLKRMMFEEMDIYL